MTATTWNAKLVNVARRYGATRQLAVDYGALLSGQIGRLVFSLVYFVTLTRALSLADFGIFASASAIGIVLSRLAGLGFISPLYRVATTRPRLIGIYTGGYLAALAASLPVIFIIIWGLHAALYASLIPLTVFAAIVLAETLMLRTLEMVIIVNNGLNRFITGSSLAIAGVATKAAVALAFALSGTSDLALWAMIYLTSNTLVALIAIVGFYPRQRLRWKPKAWFGRARDALGVSAAEMLFYVQSELDKVLVLALGGEVVAGLYAIVLRIVDLTAMPLRAMSTLLTQWIMRARQARRETRHGLLLDLALGIMSAVALLGAAALLWLVPEVGGRNIAMAVAFLPSVLLVPAFRNIVEYHTELLYAHEQMARRVWLLAALGVTKAALLAVLLTSTSDFAVIALWLNAVFAALWALSAAVTYSGLSKTSAQKDTT